MKGLAHHLVEAIWILLVCGIAFSVEFQGSTQHPHQPNSLEGQRAVLESKRNECEDLIIKEEDRIIIQRNANSTNIENKSYLPNEEDLYLSLNNNENRSLCPTVFDDVYCWPQTRPNTLVIIPCPSYVNGFSAYRNASKYCTPEGLWFTPLDRNTSWSNYSDCKDALNHEDFGPHELLSWTSVVRTVSKIGYSVSLVTLLVAFTVLASFKRLHCPRNTLHMHLFFSFICRAVCALNRDHDTFLPSHSPATTAEVWGCRLFTSAWQYFILANYSWILMEGLYLHNLVFLALFTDNSAITLYIALGWGIPLIIVIGWSLSRVIIENTHCWTTNKNQAVFWIFVRGPITLSILVSFVLFIKITRELLLKLRFQASSENLGSTYRRWARSTLVLMPLFGVHYAALLGFTYFMGRHSTLELIWLFTDQFFASFQGFMVATLYCLLNGEVRHELTKLWNFWRRERLNNEFTSPGNSLYQYGNSKSFASRGSSPGAYIGMQTRKNMSGLPFTVSQDVYHQRRPTQDLTDDTLAADDAYASIDLSLPINDSAVECVYYAKTQKLRKINAKERSCSVDTYVLEVSPTIGRASSSSIANNRLSPSNELQIDRPASSYGQYSSEMLMDPLQVGDIRRERSVGCIVELGKKDKFQDTKTMGSSPKGQEMKILQIPSMAGVPNMKQNIIQDQTKLVENSSKAPEGPRNNLNGRPNVKESSF